MPGRHRAPTPSWRERFVPPALASGRARPVLAAGLSGALMVGLCAATLAPEPTSDTPQISTLSGPLPLRGVDDRASRNGTRATVVDPGATDLAREAEAAAAATRLARERAAQRQQAQTKAARDAAVAEARPAGGTPEQNRALGRFLVLEHGWSEAQFDCYDRLIVSESDWRTTADNPSSSAYGIPQALPGSKMSSAGADWETNPETQILWSFGYIEDVYGTPCSAWSFKQSNNWY